MSDGQEWIGTIKLTNEDTTYGSDGEKILDYTQCSGDLIDKNSNTILEGKLPKSSKFMREAADITYTRSLYVSEDERYVGTRGTVTSYTRTWVEKESYSITGAVNTYIRGICEAPEYPDCFYWLAADTVNKVGRYNKTTGQQELSIATGLVDARGLTYYNGFLYIGNNRDYVHEYTLDGVPTGVQFYHGVGLIVGVERVGDGWWIWKSSQAIKFNDQWETTGDEIRRETSEAWYAQGSIDPTGNLCHSAQNTGSIDEMTLDLYAPDMVAPTGSPNPYKIVSDNTSSAIGKIVNSDADKWQDEIGVDKFDLVLCDGAFPDANHPQLAQYMLDNPVYSYDASFDASSINTRPFAIVDDGVYLWFSGIDVPLNMVHRLNHDFTTTGFSIDISGTHDDKWVFGIASLNDTLWIQADDSGGYGIFYRYTKAGVYTGQSAQPTEDGNIRGIFWDGTHLWGSGKLTGRIYQYDENFVPTGFSIILIHSGATANGLTGVGDILYSGGTANGIYGYNKITGEYLGKLLDTDTRPCSRGITLANEVLTVIGDDNTVEPYTNTIGRLPNYPAPVAPNQPYKIMADLT